MTLKNLIATGINEPRKIIEKIFHILFSKIGHRNYKHFIIVARDRTGSNLLLQFLNSHPNIKADWEIFNKLAGESEEEILSKCFSRQPFYIKAKGFKIFYMHPMDDNTGKIWDMLQAMHDLHVIHLKRKNILRTEMSSKIAYLTGVWRIRPGDKRPEANRNTVTIHLSKEELEQRFELTKKWENRADHRFNNHHKLTIYYEDLSSWPKEVFRTITDFLGVEYRQPHSTMRKQATRRMKEVISNYDELKTSFFETEWQSFFED